MPKPKQRTVTLEERTVTLEELVKLYAWVNVLKQTTVNVLLPGQIEKVDIKFDFYFGEDEKP